MKNKKKVYVLAIAALILVLGVGYAVVSSVTLGITGTGSTVSTDLKVVYDGVNTNSGARVTAQTGADDSKAATFTVENMVLNVTEYAEFEIKNKETDVNATVKVPTVNFDNDEFFDVKVYYNDTLWTANQTLNAQATAKVKVTVTLIKTPVEAADSTTTVSVEFDADPVA